MKITADYHIHTIYSDRKHCTNEIENIIKKAIESELREIAITDHGFRHAFYGTNKEEFIEAKKEIERLRKKYTEIKILHGIEANIINYSGETDIDDFIKQNCDIILLGFHFGTKFKGISSKLKFFVFNKIPCVRKKMINKNTQAIINAIRKNDFNILTHPGEKIPVDIVRIALEASKKNIILEINDSHKKLSSEDLERIKDIDVRLVVNSDAHTYEGIGNYNNAIERIVKSGTDIRKIINLEV